jgi:Na+/H+ antiporter NhaD/arsenite permease-like protein
MLGGLYASAAQAGDAQAAQLGVYAAIPFLGLLFSIALLPMLASHFWHAHRGKVALAWALALCLPMAVWQGVGAAVHSTAEALLGDYVPFVLLTGALYTVSGGIHIRGRWRGSPGVNLVFLLTGALLASLMGTTGAAMLLIRPLLQANASRQHQTHVAVFFIFVVANAAGVLTPLGDPPLFMGFLQGVPFTWPLVHLWPQALFVVGSLLALFGLLDWVLWRREPVHANLLPLHKPVLDGARNLCLLGVIVGVLLWSGSRVDGGATGGTMGGTWSAMGVDLRGVVLRNLCLLAVVLLSLRITPARVYADNQFSWAPMVEVAQLFAALFVTMAPVLALLKEGESGPFGALLSAVSHSDGRPNPALYFWATGGLSAFLDNAPTYLVFFNLAGGQADVLTGPQALTLAAISTGAVFMGALTYIGNAPNLMVRAIAVERGVAMPGFLAYMLCACLVMLPLMGITSYLWFGAQ